MTTYDADDPFALPSVDGLVIEATRWISGHQDGRASFYSAEDGPKTPRTRKPRAGTAKATPSGKKQEKGARVTTASLAANIEVLMDMIPALSEQVSTVVQRQSLLEDQLRGRGSLEPTSNPIYDHGAWKHSGPSTGFGSKGAGFKAKDKSSGQGGAVSLTMIPKPTEVVELEDEKNPDRTLAQDRPCWANLKL